MSNNNKTVFELNGRKMNLDVPFSKRLIDVLREDLQLTGTKIACEVGRCGACMVLINGKAQNACLTMTYQCSDKKVVTIEGASELGLDFVQRAFLEEGGFQCGYCTPGMIMSVKSVLEANPNPTLEQLKDGLTGNLCRCTGYGGIIRALKRINEEAIQMTRERGQGVEGAI